MKHLILSVTDDKICTQCHQVCLNVTYYRSSPYCSKACVHVHKRLLGGSHSGGPPAKRSRSLATVNRSQYSASKLDSHGSTTPVSLLYCMCCHLGSVSANWSTRISDRLRQLEIFSKPIEGFCNHFLFATLKEIRFFPFWIQFSSFQYMVTDVVTMITVIMSLVTSGYTIQTHQSIHDLYSFQRSTCTEHSDEGDVDWDCKGSE